VKDLHYASLGDVCARIKSGELSSVQVTQAMLERIGMLDGELRSYVLVLADSALETAERLDQARAEGRPLGALHGVPIALKDLLYTRGIPTASGTIVMRNFVPDEDATVVSRLKQAGAVLIGKTQLTEGAFGVHHPDIAPPLNPWNHDHWAGVSSSGSGVAVAAGLAFGALGTDTGGSIRFPSASCGIVGIKPTYGLVSRHGVFPLAESLDHIGPMTRNVADAARMLQVLAGHDPKDATTLAAPVPNYAASLGTRVDGLTVGVDWRYVETGVEPEVVDSVRESITVLRSLGADVREVTMPSSYARLVHDWALTCSVECARAHRDWYPKNKRLYGPVLSGLIELGLTVTQQSYDELESLRRRFSAELDGLLGSVDLLISPCMPSLPPTAAEMVDVSLQVPDRADILTFTAPSDYSGHPTITLPVGLSRAGLPKAVQLLGRKQAEPTLVRAGHAFEQACSIGCHPVP